MVIIFIGCLITGVGIFSFANIFGLMSKDERHQSNTTNTKVQRHNIWLLLIGLATLAIGFVIMILAGA